MDEAKKLKKINYIALGVVIAVVLGLVAGLLVFRERHRFRREKWIAEPESRTRIVDDLLAEHELVGMTREEILGLLGADDNDAGYFQEEGRMVYWLGPERGLISIDSEWLILDFSGGIVTDRFITRD